MAELGGTRITLLDIAKRMDPDGSIGAIAELLHQKNDMLDDIPWKESNLPTGHQANVRTSLPTPNWKQANAGSPVTKSTTAQIVDTIGILEDWSEVDQDVADLNGNTAEFRLSEADAHIEGMAQEVAQTLFYGNTGTAPSEFNGLATRYSATTLNLGQNILLGGGSGSDNSSVWLVGWSDKTVCGIYPKGTMAGLEHKDLGMQIVETVAGTGTTARRMMAYVDHFKWKCGLSVMDWRYAVRIANVDISALVAKSSAADLYDLMIKAIVRIPNLSNCNPVFYMNRTCWQMLAIQGRDDVISGGGLTFENVSGKMISRFMGIPVKISDQLTEAESPAIA